ncbi:glycosyltransferase family 2 protein [Candidatus Roizmanbacteria bacterium]|nr:glycosyltransferase family 2 protein [Candidatus Roizmanbacteria bacterium]
MPHFLLSLIIPVYNEEKNIHPLVKDLLPLLENYKYELIFVNDGSVDGTVQNIKDITSHNPNVKLVSFNRNFGHQNALSCGYQLAKGDCVITLDADGQDPPQIIPEMIQKWTEGAKVVYAKRIKRVNDSFFKKSTAYLFYRFMNILSDTIIPENVGDYRLLDKEVVTFLNQLPEQSRFLRGLVAWGGYPAEFVYFHRGERKAGTTHYTVPKMINFALDGITAFSEKPLRLASYLGFLTATLGFIGVIYALLTRFFFPGYWVTGWTALFTGIMFLGGVQLISIGIIGEYIAKIYKEVQKRPPFIIKEKINI